MRLTKRKIESLEFDPDGPSQQIEWDDRLSNFGVRLYESGTKSFVIRYRNEHSRRRYMTIGKFGRMTLQQARAKALEKFVEIDDGGDPVGERRHASTHTMGELVDAFLEKHCKVRREASYDQAERRLLKHVKPRWESMPPEALTRADVSALHRELKDTPYEANRIISLMRTMYGFAADEGIVEDGFNPCSRVNMYDEKSRERWLRPHEIKPLSDAIDAVSNAYMRHYYWLLLLTAARRNELLEVKWKHVDLERRELLLIDTKNGTDHIVPLSAPAIAHFEAIPKQKGNPWVFCGRYPGTRRKNVNDLWNGVRAEAGLSDVRLHDFRRTAASWLAQTGYSMIVIQKLLNHTLQGVTGVYARMQPGAVREAVEDYGRKLMAAKTGGETDVVSLFASRGK